MEINQTDIIKRIDEFIEYDALLSNAAFAAKAGIDPSGFNKMLKGQQTITKGTIAKIASTYNLRPEWLLYGKGEMYQPKQKSEEYETKDAFKDIKGNNIGVHNDSDIIKGLFSTIKEKDDQISRLLTLLESKDNQINNLLGLMRNNKQ